MMPPCSYFILYERVFRKSIGEPYKTLLYGPVVSGPNAYPTSKVCSPVMLVIPIAGNRNYDFRIDPVLEMGWYMPVYYTGTSFVPEIHSSSKQYMYIIIIYIFHFF
jgi:hypothetical protein